MAIFVNRESRTDGAFPLTAMAILRGAMPPFAGDRPGGSPAPAWQGAFPR